MLKNGTNFVIQEINWTNVYCTKINFNGFQLSKQAKNAKLDYLFQDRDARVEAK